MATDPSTWLASTLGVTPIVAPRVVARETDGVPCIDAGTDAGPCFVDVAVDELGRAHAHAALARAFTAWPARAIPVLCHAGPEAGRFLVERPVGPSDVMPTHGRRARALDDEGWRDVLARALAAARHLMAIGASTLVLSLDDGGLLASTLSPRTNPVVDENHRIERGLMFVRALAALDVPLGVALTVEERFPGGIDARLGVTFALAAEREGARFFVASAREPFAARAGGPVDDTGDPALASAAWLVGRVRAPVLSCLATSDAVRTATRARTFGLAGVVVHDASTAAHGGDP